MQVKVIDNANVLIPNATHKNFTETSEIIPKGTLTEGSAKSISGLRRGKEFTYKLFLTKDNKLIYIKKTKPMETTEVTFNAAGDGSKTRTISLPTHKSEIYGAVLGAASGFGFAKYKKYELKKTIISTVIGAAIGLGIGYAINTRNAKLKITKP